MDRSQLTTVVLDAIRVINQAREPADQISESIEAPLFGGDSPLDSLGLVALLMEVEEGFRDVNIEISISDERAMAQRNNPFRSVSSLVDYIEERLEQEKA